MEIYYSTFDKFEIHLFFFPKMSNYLFVKILYYYYGLLQILVWDTRRAALMQTIDLHSDVIYSLSLNRDGSRLATTSRDKRLRIIDPRSGKLLQVRKFSSEFFYCRFGLFSLSIMMCSVFFQYPSLLVFIFGKW